jgi:predicted CXXCH cytochrome family protein
MHSNANQVIAKPLKSNQGRRPWLLLVLLMVGVVGFLVSCATNRTAVQPLEIPGAVYVGNHACAECHAPYTRSFNSTPHARLHVNTAGAAQHTGCESCHGPGSRHVELGGSPQAIINPGKKPGACYACHEEIEALFRLPRHHPVPEGKMNCVQCHDPHGAEIFRPNRSLAMARVNNTCGNCHREQSRPVMFQHEALREGCTTCHVPHGSFNAAMLVERDVNLCLKCHAQVQGPASGGDVYIGKVPHGAYLRQGTCWTAGCHSAVHGSNVNPHLRY